MPPYQKFLYILTFQLNNLMWVVWGLFYFPFLVLSPLRELWLLRGLNLENFLAHDLSILPFLFRYPWLFDFNVPTHSIEWSEFSFKFQCGILDCELLDLLYCKGEFGMNIISIVGAFDFGPDQFVFTICNCIGIWNYAIYISFFV